ncbi:nucleotidyltransferase family protein [bacterium]|nr:nucleotidyltransferase family protein [bacterium]
MIYAIALAAGESRRMGAPKQLLPFGDKTVLQAVVDRLLASRADGVLVVLGCRADEVRATLADRSVRFALNPDYARGMLSSVQAGVAALPPDARAALICLGDHPSVDPAVVDRVIEAHRRTGKGIVIPTSSGRRGHPALVSLRYRDEILALCGEPGLKAVMRGHPEDTVEVEVGRPEILDDMDTPEDYQKAIKAHGL